MIKKIMTKEEAIKHLAHKIAYYRSVSPSYGEISADAVNVEALEMAIIALKQPERKKGKWINATDTSGGDYYRCSECGTYIEKMYFANDYTVNFCPNCGVEMERETC